MRGMASRLFYSVVRIVCLCVAAGVGYVAVYVPLMKILFSKHQPESFLFILGLSIAAALKCAQLADGRLPRSVGRKVGAESGG